MLRKSIISLSIATFSSIDTYASLPMNVLAEVAEDVKEVLQRIGKK